MSENGCGEPARKGQWGPLDQARVDLAAKDAEIAELRAKLEGVRDIRNEHYDLQGEHEETSALLGAWRQRAQQAEAERDEARECVGSLYGELMAAVNAGRVDIESDDHFWRRIIDALAATPEHLRG